jgi:hypothetical protein
MYLITAGIAGQALAAGSYHIAVAMFALQVMIELWEEDRER